jgi:hypothetical protein
MRGVGELEGYDYVLGKNPDFAKEVTSLKSDKSDTLWKQRNP